MEIGFRVKHAGGECSILAYVREDGLLDIRHSSCEELFGPAFGRMCACRVLIAERDPEVARAAWNAIRSKAHTMHEAYRAYRFLEQYARDEKTRYELVSSVGNRTGTPVLLTLLRDHHHSVRYWAGEQLTRQLAVDEIPIATAFVLENRHEWSPEYWVANAVAQAVQREKGPRARALGLAHFLAMYEPGRWEYPYVPEELPLSLRKRLRRLYDYEFDRAYRKAQQRARAARS